jgi:imidazolonepropionase-like amidohydrolase
LFAVKKVGAQKTVISDDGKVRVTYSHRDNGRGPDLEEEIALAPDGTFRSYRLTGRTTYGAILDERFTISRSRASWRSASERGEKRVEGAAIYNPNYNSPEAMAMIARAVAKAGGRLAALPGGELRIEKVKETRVGEGDGARAIALHAVFGFGVQPEYLWLEADEAMGLFAVVNPGGSHLVVAGYEGVTPELERIQQEAEAAFLAGIAQKQTQRLADPILIRNVRPFDSKKAALGAPADVYVSGGRIAAIFPAGSTPRDAATVIDGAGRALLPGLFDMHSHEDAWNSALQIAGGVTTSRDMGNDNAVLADLIADIGRGELLGPHIEACGYIEGESPFSSRGGFVVASVEEAKEAIDWYAQRGYRQVKLYNSMKPEWAAPVAEHAHSRGLRVSGHVPAFSRAERVVREGYDELQHINQLMLNFVSEPDTDSRTIVRFNLVGDRSHTLDLDSKAVQDFIALLAERGTVIDATMATFEGTWNQAQGDVDPSMAAVVDHLPYPEQRALHVNSTDVSGGKLETYRASWKRMMEFLGRLHAAGVPLVAGTDSTAGFMLHRELELYVQAGVKPGEAVRIATENGARYAGVLSETGTIERGKRADLILVDGDPTTNISDIRNVSYVLKEGVGYAPAGIYESFGIRRFTDPPAITRRDGTPVR